MSIVFDVLEGLFLCLVDNAVSSAKDVHGVMSYEKCPDYCQSLFGRLRGEVGLGRKSSPSVLATLSIRFKTLTFSTL
jgi:hypothetical protein